MSKNISEKKVSIDSLKINGKTFFKIENVDALRPFFMSVVSSGNHWMFLSNNGGISAGRKNENNALFPYYTDDKITESSETTGSKTLIRVSKNNQTYLWEPFSEKNKQTDGIYRNIYKNLFGNSVIFEEINENLSLVFKYQWNTSEKFGFIRKSSLQNIDNIACKVEIVDGLQNILPQGVSSDLQNAYSNLVDAYKRSELLEQSGIGIFALSAIIVDKAEPSESLKANITWSFGINAEKYLLSSNQLKNFRNLKPILSENDVKGEKGAYFINNEFSLVPNHTQHWGIVADVNKTQSDVIALSQMIQQNENLIEEIENDIALSTENLIVLNASADAVQQTANDLNDARHFSNVLFNVMRGGIFDFNYQIDKSDFYTYLQQANFLLFEEIKNDINQLPDTFHLFELRNHINKINNPIFERLAIEYLPLRFSRRHGDPTRPWNKFSINTQSEKDGSKILDYQGNWRDIFQNWEALAFSFPEFIEGMIFKFLNASTFDGYNPYRVTKDGFDWETIEPDDPWSYIGYWGDHQIIYLLKFLEFAENLNPGKLATYFDKDIFVYANVPYKIKAYEKIVENPKDTISFDENEDAKIRLKRQEIGADGALHFPENGSLYHVNFIEKILVTILTKMSNFIPDAGIWMNTQRPEWNDANNALVGNGASMVTLAYLHRFMLFFQKIIENSTVESIKISSELMDFYKGIRQILIDNTHILKEKNAGENRKIIIDALGHLASEYRTHIYSSGFWGKKRSISTNGLKNFTRVSIAFIENSIKANQRKDGMFHTYNLITITDKKVSIAFLEEMLEGQFAVLSSKYLNAKEALNVLDALKNSSLFRKDQYSYILYPNKNLPGFLEKNNVPKEQVLRSDLLKKLIDIGNTDIIIKDILGNYHFNANFRNVKDLEAALKEMQHAEYADDIEKEKMLVLDIYESVFNHKAFTGRSGTFFGYEGLGSIYWHMVSKLLLAVQENVLLAIASKENDEIIGRLLEHYYEIQAGIGVHKSPELYGAFPTDPYSHTPAGKGAQQPGMTGQVKEDILCRWGELGVFIREGKLHFNPCILRKSEFLSIEKNFNYINVIGERNQIKLPAHSLAFTFCQVPIIYHIADTNKIVLSYNDSSKVNVIGLELNKTISDKVFQRTNEINELNVYLEKSLLK